MTWSLDGKTVFITGAARGIGAEAARQLRAKGARVALAGLEPELLEERAAELGGDTAWFEADVSDRDAVAAAVEQAVERFGGLDVVIANAGVAGGGPVASVDPDAFETVIDVNLLGVYRTVRAALPHVTARGGYVLPIASLAAALHGPMMSAYARQGAPARAAQAAARLGRGRSGRARRGAAGAPRLRAAVGAGRALPADPAAAAQRAGRARRRAHRDDAAGRGGGDGAHDAATALGLAPARSAAAVSASVPATIAARRSVISAPMKARLWSVSRRRPVSSRFLSR